MGECRGIPVDEQNLNLDVSVCPQLRELSPNFKHSMILSLKYTNDLKFTKGACSVLSLIPHKTIARGSL